jgi:hypothetical protein
MLLAFESEGKTGLVIAHSEADIRKLRNVISAASGDRLTCREIGAVAGETLDSVLEAGIEQGATSVFSFHAFDAAGDPIFAVITPEF